MRKLTNLLPLLPVLALVSWISYGFWQAYQPQPELLQGQIEAQQYSISSKVAGRIEQVLVREGQQIDKHQLVFTLDSPELDARMQQAKAGSDAAAAMAEQAENGARSQELAAAEDQWRTAQAAADLAEKTYQRLNNLYQEGVVSEQTFDEASTRVAAARYTASAAQQMYLMAQEGARDELKRAAQQQAKAAQGVVAEVQAFSLDKRISSPHQGEVSQVLLQPGELAPQGFPVVTLLDLDDVWMVLHLREDRMRHFAKDRVFEARIPALGEQHYAFKVTRIAAMGDFATWRATDSRAGFDLRTFEIEARPVTPIEGLRAGMSTVIHLPNDA